MKILNIETATEICSVCLSENGEVISLRENCDGNQHSRVLTLLIEETMREAGFSLKQIDAVALTSGPGSYTSLRVGTSVAKGICYALDKPLIAIGTLESLAFAARASGSFSDNALFVPMIDARRMEVFTAIYDSQLSEALEPQAMIIDHNSFENYLLGSRQLVFCGNGATKCKAVLAHPQMVFLDIFSTAANLSKLSFSYFQNKVFQDVAYFEPAYIKPPNITISSKSLIINEMENFR